MHGHGRGRRHGRGRGSYMVVFTHCRLLQLRSLCLAIKTNMSVCLCVCVASKKLPKTSEGCYGIERYLNVYVISDVQIRSVFIVILFQLEYRSPMLGFA